MSNLTDYELCTNHFLENRSVKTLVQNLYNASLTNSNIPKQYLGFLEAIIRYAGDQLLASPKIEITTFPAFLVPNHQTKECVPLVAATRMLKTYVEFPKDLPLDETNSDTIKRVGDEVVQFYWQHFIYDRPAYTPDIIILYNLIFCTEVVADPQNDVRRLGFMTRYAKYKF